MKRRTLAVLVILVLLLGPSSSSADPTNWAHLAQIIAWLQQIDRTLAEVNDLVEDIRTKLASTSTRKTPCGRSRSSSSPSTRSRRRWRSSPATGASRPASSSCASPSSRAVRSAAETGTRSSARRRSPSDWDLEHYYDWSSVRRMNLIRTRNEKRTRARRSGRVAGVRGDPGS